MNARGMITYGRRGHRGRPLRSPIESTASLGLELDNEQNEVNSEPTTEGVNIENGNINDDHVGNDPEDKTLFEYEAEFLRLSRYAPSMVAAEQEKSCRFQKGLRYNLKVQRAKEARPPQNREAVDPREGHIQYQMQAPAQNQGPVRGQNQRVAEKMVRKGCKAVLAYVRDASFVDLAIEGIRTVSEYPDVFPDELLGLPPEREVEFRIVLLLGTAPVSIIPYRMAPKELKKLKV
nr:unnamed protein product [Gossypium raimondii]